jgi:hypothetical protein
MGNNYSSVPFQEGESVEHPTVLLLGFFLRYVCKSYFQLGNEYSGKTTMIKQARLSSTGLIPEAEKKEMIPAIYKGIIQTVKDMIGPAQELGLEFDKVKLSIHHL